MSEETVPKRQYTEEFKLVAVRLPDSVGGHEAARRLGIPIATLSNWFRRSRQASWQGIDRVCAKRADTPVANGPGSGEQPTSQGTGQRQTGRGNPSKGNGVFRKGIAVKYAWIDTNRDHYEPPRL